MSVVNPGRGEVALVVGAGVSLTLRFTTGALSSLQEALGFPHTAEGCALLFAQLETLELEDLPLVVFHGLVDRDRDPLRSVDAIEKLIFDGVDLSRMSAVTTAVTKAIKLSFPEHEAEAKTQGQAKNVESFSWASLKRAALRHGLTTDEFWNLTPREVREAIRAAAWRKDDSMAQTWLGAAWSRQGAKLPPITDFVSDEYARKPTPKASIDLMSLAKAWGSNVYDETGQPIVISGAPIETPLKDKN